MNLAGDTMRDMVVSVNRRVTQIVAEISNATAEQAAGIASVNDAVADIERSAGTPPWSRHGAAAAALEIRRKACARHYEPYSDRPGGAERHSAVRGLNRPDYASGVEQDAARCSARSPATGSHA